MYNLRLGPDAPKLILSKSNTLNPIFLNNLFNGVNDRYERCS